MRWRAPRASAASRRGRTRPEAAAEASGVRSARRAPRPPTRPPTARAASRAPKRSRVSASCRSCARRARRRSARARRRGGGDSRRRARERAVRSRARGQRVLHGRAARARRRDRARGKRRARRHRRARARALGGQRGDGPLVLSTELEIVMGDSDAAQQLVLGAFAVSVVGDAFESLSFSLSKNGASQRSTLFFDTAEEVIAFFARERARSGHRLERGRRVRRALRARARRRHAVRDRARLCHRRAGARHGAARSVGLVLAKIRRRAAFSA